MLLQRDALELISGNEIQDGSKGRIDKKGLRLMVGARQCPGLKGR